MLKFSIVFPVYNEMNNPYFWDSLENFLQFNCFEIIVIDGGSQDGTWERVNKHPVFCKRGPTDRASRLNIGVEECTGDLILLHHPRSLISISGINELLKLGLEDWGGFKHHFDKEHFLLKFTSWYSNYGRRVLWKILYLDHCIFIPKSVLKEVFPLPRVEVFEDTYLSYRLRKALGRPRLLSSIVKTSAVRFCHKGIYKQSLLNQLLKVQFHLGVSSKYINRIYERELTLNTKWRS